MPPKSCRGRDTTNLQEYINDPLKEKKSLFVRALFNSKILQKFDGQVGVNECVFSYPDSEWYAVYLLDSDGQQIWDPATGAKMLFFKLKVSPSGKEAIISAETTDISQTDLVGKQACSVNSNGNCVLPGAAPSPETRKTTAKKTSPKPAPEEPQEKVDSEVAERLQSMSISSSKKSSEKVDRAYFENLDSKMLIAQWMIDNMDEKDIIECVKQGSLSPEDVQRVEKLSKSAPAGSSPAPSSSKDAEAVAAEIAAGMEPEKVKKIFQRMSKEDLIADLKKNYPGDRKQAIVEMCKRAGKKLEIRETKRGPKLFDFNGEQVDESDALDECAAFEAERIRQRLAYRWTSVMRNVRSAVDKGKMPAYSEPGPVMETGPMITTDSIMSEINGIEDPVARKQAIIDLVTPFGFTTRPGKRGIMILDPDGEQVSDQIALEEGAGLKAATINSVSFGRRRRASKKQLAVRKRFKKAAKKCKGKRNFRKCVGKILRKKSSFGKKTVRRKSTVPGVRRKYTSGGGRKSPGVSATLFSVGTVKTGLDGNAWVIKKASNGVKRWSKK